MRPGSSLPVQLSGPAICPMQHACPRWSCRAFGLVGAAWQRWSNRGKLYQAVVGTEDVQKKCRNDAILQRERALCGGVIKKAKLEAPE